MTVLSQLLDAIQKIPDCDIRPPQGLPSVAANHVVPNDLLEFYSLCGGVSLFSSSAYSMEIVPPSRCISANPVIFIGISEAQLRASRDDISWSWYIIGEGKNRQYITTDFALERLGRCYDSFWDSHAMPGYSPIIARSFTELLSGLVSNQGQHWYWLQPNFQSLGDAYD
jgi:hypothetical protein